MGRERNVCKIIAPTGIRTTDLRFVSRDSKRQCKLKAGTIYLVTCKFS